MNGVLRIVSISVKRRVMLWRLRLKYKSSILETNAISLENIHQFQIGKNSSVGKGSILVVSSRGRQSSIRVGSNTYIGEYNNIRAAAGEIVIGNGCMISQFVTIVTSNHGICAGTPISKQEWVSKKGQIVIGDDVWIGAGATILPDVSIADGAVIGAGAIVTKDVPANAIVIGDSAKVYRFRNAL